MVVYERGKVLGRYRHNHRIFKVTLCRPFSRNRRPAVIEATRAMRKRFNVPGNSLMDAGIVSSIGGSEAGFAQIFGLGRPLAEISQFIKTSLRKEVE